MNKKDRDREKIELLKLVLDTPSDRRDRLLEDKIDELTPFERLHPLTFAEKHGTPNPDRGGYDLPNGVWFEPGNVTDPTGYGPKGLCHGWASAKHYDAFQKTFDPVWISRDWQKGNWTTANTSGKKLSKARIEKNRTRKDLYKSCTETERTEYLVDVCSYTGCELDYVAGSNPHSDRSKSIGLFHTAATGIEPSTDRIDDNVGYTKDNTQIISNNANKFKEECNSKGTCIDNYDTSIKAKKKFK